MAVSQPLREFPLKEFPPNSMQITRWVEAVLTHVRGVLKSFDFPVDLFRKYLKLV